MMLFIKLITWLGAVLIFVHTGTAITGGSFVNIQDYPYQASIYAFNSYRCSGVIINASWIISTTHCLSVPREDVTIRVGTVELTGGSLHKASKVYEHDHYGSNLARYNDIALVQIEPPIVFDETKQPIPLVDANVSITEGDRGAISGWASYKQVEEKSPLLKAVSVNVMSLLECVETYHSRFGYLQPGIICAKNEPTGGAACSVIWGPDDSGAPLVVDGKFAGVFSWGYLCDRPGFPSVFMEISFYRQWIARITGF